MGFIFLVYSVLCGIIIMWVDMKCNVMTMYMYLVKPVVGRIML